MVRTNALVVRYGKFRALDGLDCSFHANTVTGLLGPNGAGKTTLIKTILGFLPVASGTCEVMGRTADGGSAKRQALEMRRAVGYMPETQAWFPGYTGLEAVVLAGRLCGMPKEAAFSRAYEVLDYLGMDEVRHRQVSQYSVGLRQKIKLAQAVVHGPRFVLLDEPLAGLDPRSRDEMLALLQGIAAGGTAMVISSHVLADLETFCSSVLVMDRGKKLYQGSMEGLRQQDHGLFSLRIKGNEEAFVTAVRARGGERERGKIQAGQQLEVRVPGADTASLWAAALETGVQIRELRPASDSLETAFLRLLGRDERGKATDEDHASPGEGEV